MNPTRETISPNGRMMHQTVQTSANTYETANFRKTRGPWGNGTVWVLTGERVRHEGVALPWVEPVAPAPVPVESAEVARETVDTYGVRRLEEAHQQAAREERDWEERKRENPEYRR